MAYIIYSFPVSKSKKIYIYIPVLNLCNFFQVQEYEKNEEKLRLDTGKEFNFDFFFDLAQKKETEDSDADSDIEEIEAEPMKKNKKKSPGSGRKHKKSR